MLFMQICFHSQLRQFHAILDPIFQFCNLCTQFNVVSGRRRTDEAIFEAETVLGRITQFTMIHSELKILTKAFWFRVEKLKRTFQKLFQLFSFSNSSIFGQN